MGGNKELMKVMFIAIAFILALVAMPVVADSGLPGGYTKIKDWDQVHEAFSFSLEDVTSESGDFFIAVDRIHVFDSPGIIDMGDIPLADIKEVPDSGYLETAKPIEGHSYAIRSHGKYGKIRIEDIFTPKDYEWVSVTEYELEWVYQPSGTRSFGVGDAPEKPVAPGQIETEVEYEYPLDAQQAYQQYIAAYNKLTSLMAEGKGDTTQAQEAYEEYVAMKACYESWISGTENPSTSTTIQATPIPSPAEQLKISDLRGTLNTDNDCNLYVADYGYNQVKMINPDGSATIYVSGIDKPRYQIFDSTGRLYVGSFDGNIYKVSTTGGKTVIARGIWSPQGMAFDDAGNLYVAGGYDGKIHRIASDGSKITMDSGFTYPKHLAVKTDGNVYVAGNSGTFILRIIPGGEKTKLVDLDDVILGMATDDEYLYVSHSDKISKIDSLGQVTHIAIDLDQPSSLAICNGNVFVTVRDGIVKMNISDDTKTWACDWDGAWETDWGRMELQQNGNSVNGIYLHDQGRIQGTVSGRNLIGTWSEYPSYSLPGDAGDLMFVISEDCSSFDGKWRYGTTGGWSGSWIGARV